MKQITLCPVLTSDRQIFHVRNRYQQSSAQDDDVNDGCGDGKEDEDLNTMIVSN